MTEIRTSSEFAEALSTLLDDKSFPAENVDTRRFIEAMQAWLKDVEGNNNWFENPSDAHITWSDLYKLLQASAVYE
ncbi:DUF7660 family protein [Kiloniella sp. b19]|uniref:DUF7660 family protein n=1 Tax=Kiloniella sp. GXU_MW_B19 TaxID=3141326 RepID=UPI0031DEF9C5